MLSDVKIVLKTCKWVSTWVHQQTIKAMKYTSKNTKSVINLNKLESNCSETLWGFLTDLLLERLDPVGFGAVRESSGGKKGRGPLVGISESICSLLMYYNVLRISTLLYALEAVNSVWRCLLSTAWGTMAIVEQKDVSWRLNRSPWGEVSHSRPLQLKSLDAFCMYQQVTCNRLYHLNLYYE